MPCLAAKPIVDGFEKDLQGRARVIRLDVTRELGRETAVRYGVRGVPTTVVIDGDGEVALRQAGFPSRKKVVTAATA